MLTKRAMSERPGTMQPGARATCAIPLAKPGRLVPAKGLLMVRVPSSKLTRPQLSSRRVKQMPKGEQSAEKHLIRGRAQM